MDRGSAASAPSASTPEPIAPAGLEAGRVEALGDGVFSIVMTLLILELKTPHLPAGADLGTALGALAGLAPAAFGYLLSFFALANFWIAHRAQFHFVRRTDRTLLWLNLLFYFTLTTVPFSTAFLAENVTTVAAVVLYGLNLSLAALALLAHWRYAMARPALVESPPAASAIRQQSRRILVGPLLYLLGMLLAPLNTWLSIGLYLLVPVYYVLPGGIDRHWFDRR